MAWRAGVVVGGEFKLVEMAQVIKRSHGNEKEILRVREREREREK